MRNFAAARLTIITRPRQGRGGWNAHVVPLGIPTYIRRRRPAVRRLHLQHFESHGFTPEIRAIQIKTLAEARPRLPARSPAMQQPLATSGPLRRNLPGNLC